jgi:hypothetical protein
VVENVEAQKNLYEKLDTVMAALPTLVREDFKDVIDKVLNTTMWDDAQFATVKRWLTMHKHD